MSPIFPTVVAIAVGLVAADASAVQSPLDRDIVWTDGVVNAVARPLIVTSSAPPTGGDRLADPADPGTTGGLDLTGVASLFLDVDPAPGSGAICSGSLLVGGRFVLTAAHCVTDEEGELAIQDGGDGNVARFETTAGLVVAPFTVADVAVHPGYDGDVRNGFDVAVIDLGEQQPASVARYALNDGSVGEAGAHLAAGFGQSGDGLVGTNTGAGDLRSGFNNFVSTGLPVGGINNLATQLTADFDSGSTGNDAFGVFGPALFGAPVADPAALGFGADEIGVAPGDSGGPSFVAGPDGPVIAGVHSYGLRLELLNGTTSDLDGVLNSSFGEFSIDARVSNPDILAFIESVAVPEPTAFTALATALVTTVCKRRRPATPCARG
ncbi:MAG: trypsin-like serine protease [Planctomycetota bacterium]